MKILTEKQKEIMIEYLLEYWDYDISNMIGNISYDENYDRFYHEGIEFHGFDFHEHECLEEPKKDLEEPKKERKIKNEIWYVMIGQCGCDAILTDDPSDWPGYKIQFRSSDLKEAEEEAKKATKEANDTESERIFQIDQNRTR